MHKPDVDLEDMSVAPVATMFWPSTPWNDSLEGTLTNPINHILVGSILWAGGITIAYNQLFGITFSAPAAEIQSVPGFIISLVGFVFMGTGGSVLWQMLKPEKEPRRLATLGRLSFNLRAAPKVSLLSGLWIVGTLVVTNFVALEMSATPLEWIVAAVFVLLFILSRPLSISTAD